MIGWIVELINWLMGMWNKLPDSLKEKIIDLIVDGFDTSLRAYYRQEEQTKNGE